MLGGWWWKFEKQILQNSWRNFKKKFRIHDSKHKCINFGYFNLKIYGNDIGKRRFLKRKYYIKEDKGPHPVSLIL